MKRFILLLALTCFSIGRGYVTFNSEKFDEYVGGVIETNHLRNLGLKYRKGSKIQ